MHQPDNHPMPTSARSVARQRTNAAALPQWIRPQLTRLVDAAPEGSHWLHEIKYDGYRMHARLDQGAVKLLTRTGLDWAQKSAPRIHFHVRRTYSGRPSSSMRFSDATAMATSVVCRPSVRERSASPITRL